MLGRGVEVGEESPFGLPFWLRHSPVQTNKPPASKEAWEVGG